MIVSMEQEQLRMEMTAVRRSKGKSSKRMSKELTVYKGLHTV